MFLCHSKLLIIPEVVPLRKSTRSQSESSDKGIASKDP